MIYGSTTQVRENFKRFETNPLVISEAKISYYLTWASQKIEAILYKAYAIPLMALDNSTPYIPDIIISLSVDMATARCQKWLYDSNQTTEVDTAKSLMKDSLEMLWSYVTDGKDKLFLPCLFKPGVAIDEKGNFVFNLPYSETTTEIWQTNVDASGNGYKQIFDEDDWPDADVSINKIDDMYEERHL